MGMKHLTITLISLLVSMGAWGECTIKSEYNPTLDFTFNRLHGTRDCVLDGIMKDDLMIAGYWIEKRTNTTLFIAINNIRAGKDIDLEFYGYEELYLKQLSESITDTDSIKFIKRYSYNGAEQPQIERNLREGGFRR